MEQHSGRAGGDAIAPEAAGEPVEPFALPASPEQSGPVGRDEDEPPAGKVVDLRVGGRGSGLLPALPGAGEGLGGTFGSGAAGPGFGDDSLTADGGTDDGRGSGHGGPDTTGGAPSFGALPALPQRTPLPQRSPLPVRPISETPDGTPFDAFGVTAAGPTVPRATQDRAQGGFGSLGGSSSFDGFAAGSPAPRSDARPLPARTPAASLPPGSAEPGESALELDGTDFDGTQPVPRA